MNSRCRSEQRCFVVMFHAKKSIVQKKNCLSLPSINRKQTQLVISIFLDTLDLHARIEELKCRTSADVIAEEKLVINECIATSSEDFNRLLSHLIERENHNPPVRGGRTRQYSLMFMLSLTYFLNISACSCWLINDPELSAHWLVGALVGIQDSASDVFIIHK